MKSHRFSLLLLSAGHVFLTHFLKPRSKREPRRHSTPEAAKTEEDFIAATRQLTVNESAVAVTPALEPGIQSELIRFLRELKPIG